MMKNELSPIEKLTLNKMLMAFDILQRIEYNEFILKIRVGRC